MKRTDHPYEYEGDLLKRYPRATIELSNDDVALTQADRNEARDLRHWQAIKDAKEVRAT